MGLLDKLRGEFIDIIEWLDSTNDTLAYRFERQGNEIKNGAKLVVREGQVAALVNEGKLADIYGPGTYSLETKNMPILSTLMGWKYGFNSPFKAEVYFTSTRRFTDLKWGTKNPVMLRDAEFGPVRLRAFGTYVIKVKDPAAFLRQLVGTDDRFTVEECSEQLRNTIVARLAAIIGESKIPILDLAANYDDLGKFLTSRLQPEFDPLGVELAQLLIENISLPPEVEQALDKRTSMGIVGNLQQYTQFQTATAIEAAARNPGGAAAQGLGLGAGIAMGGQMAQSAGVGAAAATAQAVPAIPGAMQVFIAVNGLQTGPFDLHAVQAEVAAGRLSRDMLVWREGLPGWTPAGEVRELSAIFPAAPPPLPK